MRLTVDDVRQVAVLSRLELSEEDLRHHTEALSKIFVHFEALSKLDTTNVEPMSHPSGGSNVLRPDERRASLTPEDALANAPQQYANCFKVPQLI